MTNYDDDYLQAYRQRRAELDALASQELSNLKTYRAQGDIQSMGISEENLANCQASIANMDIMAQQHLQAMTTPPPQREPTDEEKIQMEVWKSIAGISSSPAMTQRMVDGWKQGEQQLQKERFLKSRYGS